jgi:hypothetical protein
MKIEDLDELDRLAFGGLIRLIVESDRHFSEEEEAQIGAIGDALGVGHHGIWRMISDAAQAYPSDAEVREAAADVPPGPGRDLILASLQRIVNADGVAAEELGVLEWLEGIWA